MEHNSIILMLVVFLLILATTYWPGRKPGIERDGRIPLEDDR
jgi:cbb3-type cytochrome oxidase subunit 3